MERVSGNVFVLSFSAEGIEAIVNLTAIDEEYVMSKIAGGTESRSVNSILSMMSVRAQFNQQRKMEVWLVKLDESYTEESLVQLGKDDPQAIADLGRMGENVYGKATSTRQVIT
jgi:hypothetical protein